MDLTDEQLLLLEQLTYLDDSVYNAAGLEKPDFSDCNSVAELVDYFDDSALSKLEAEGTIENASGGSEHVQGGEIAAIIREIKDDKDLYNLDIYEITESKDTHKRDTIVFYNAEDGTDGEAIVAFRGTLDSEEWKDNFSLLVTGDTEINQEALDYINNQLPFSSIATVGHSKGGNKAAYTYYLSDKVDRCVALDAPGLPLVFYELHPEAREKAMIEGGIQAYAVTGDFVNILMYPLFGARTKYCVGYGQKDYLENHSPTTFFNYQKVGRCTFIKKNEDGTYLMFTEQDEHMQKLHGFTLFAYQFMDEETKNQMVDYLGNAIVLAMGGTITVDGVTYTKDTMADYLLSDQDMLSTLLAYLMAYANEYDMDWDDIKVFINFFSVVRFGGWRIFTNAKSGFADGKGSTDYNDFIKWLNFVFNYKDIDCDAQALVDNAYDKYVEILKMDGMGEELSDYDMSPNFFPGTSITAPSDSFVPGPPDGASVSDISSIGSEPLYLDNNVYKVITGNITNAAGELSFDTTVFDTENEVCGTESMVTLANYWHKTAYTTNGYREFCINPLTNSMSSLQTSVNTTTVNAANALNAFMVGNPDYTTVQDKGLDGKSGVFDENGSYGGDQGDAKHNQSGWFLFGNNAWHFSYNKELFDFVRQHPEYANLTDKEIRDLLSDMNSEGCGYVAVANSIFCQYEGNPEAFEKTFGFPMYDKNGEFNYNMLIVDFYLETDNKFYMNDAYGKSALINGKLNLYEDDPDAFKAKYGVDLYADAEETEYSEAAKKVVTEEVNQITDDVYILEGDDGTTAISRINRLDHYLGERGVSMDYNYSGELNTADIQAQLDAGNEVIIGADHFYLNDENGKHETDLIEGGHAMSVTGVTDDGRLIVSSWGDKYYLDPNESTVHSYTTIDIQ